MGNNTIAHDKAKFDKAVKLILSLAALSNLAFSGAIVSFPIQTAQFSLLMVVGWCL